MTMTHRTIMNLLTVHTASCSSQVSKWVQFCWKAICCRETNFISTPLQSLKDHIMQVHQPSLNSPTASMNGMAQHFSPPPSLLSPGNFPYHLNTGVHEGGRQSHSPNSHNTHACSYNQCSASFPTLELLEKHEMIQHSSGATNVVSWSFTNFLRVIKLC